MAGGGARNGSSSFSSMAGEQKFDAKYPAVGEHWTRHLETMQNKLDEFELRDARREKKTQDMVERSAQMQMQVDECMNAKESMRVVSAKQQTAIGELQVTWRLMLKELEVVFKQELLDTTKEVERKHSDIEAAINKQLSNQTEFMAKIERRREALEQRVTEANGESREALKEVFKMLKGIEDSQRVSAEEMEKQLQAVQYIELENRNVATEAQSRVEARCEDVEGKLLQMTSAVQAVETLGSNIHTQLRENGGLGSGVVDPTQMEARIERAVIDQVLLRMNQQHTDMEQRVETRLHNSIQMKIAEREAIATNTNVAQFNAPAASAPTAEVATSAVPASPSAAEKSTGNTASGTIFESSQPFTTTDVPHMSLTSYVLQRVAKHANSTTATAGSKQAIGPSLIDSTTSARVPFKELPNKVRAVGAALAQAGFSKGKVLAIVAPNMPEYVLALHAAVALGGSVALIEWRQPAAERVRQLRAVAPWGVVTMPSLAEVGGLLV
jgi:hypothetical protein